MAAGDTANVRVWTLADVYVAPVGTTAPTDIETAIAVDWKALGLISEDGLTMTRDQDSSDLFAYGGILVRTIRSKFKRSFTVTPLENSDLVWQIENPGSTSATTAAVVGPPAHAAYTTRTIKTPTVGDVRAFVFELTDGLMIARRVVPRAELVEVGERKTTADDFEAAEWTLNVYPASDGTLFKEITNDAAATVA